MDTPKPETLAINYPNDTPIAPKPAYPTWKSLFGLFFLFLLYTTVGAIFLGVFTADAKNLATPAIKSLLTLVFYLVTMLLMIRYAIKKSKWPSSATFDFSLKSIPGWLIPVIVISTLALVVGLEGISNLILMPPAVQKIFEKAFTKNAFSLITAIIAAPIMEEILCRGIVLKVLLKNYPPQKAIIISALFFAVLHLNPWQALPSFFGGLFLSWLFYKTQSIIPCIIIHATINTTASAFLFLPKQQQQGFIYLLGMPGYIVLCVVSAAVFVGGCVIIRRRVLPVAG